MTNGIQVSYQSAVGTEAGNNMGVGKKLARALDLDFLLSEEMRGVRLMLEYTRIHEILRVWRIVSTIVIFGSARTNENSTRGREAIWYREARIFSRLASMEGGAINDAGKDLENVIATGGGPGIMEAANRGAHEVGAPSIGFHVELRHEDHPNQYTTPELTFKCYYFSIRKLHLTMRANALLVFPGGFGTIDELFELLTLVQTEKTPRIPILLMDRQYWEKVIDFDYLIESNMISSEDLLYFQYVESGREAWELLKPRVCKA